jgi:hypothetical protein
MKHEITFECPWEIETGEVTVTVYATAWGEVSATMHSPAEPPEIDDVQVSLDGKDLKLTDNCDIDHFNQLAMQEFKNRDIENYEY